MLEIKLESDVLCLSMTHVRLLKSTVIGEEDSCKTTFQIGRQIN